MPSIRGICAQNAFSWLEPVAPQGRSSRQRIVTRPLLSTKASPPAAASLTASRREPALRAEPETGSSSGPRLRHLARSVKRRRKTKRQLPLLPVREEFGGRSNARERANIAEQSTHSGNFNPILPATCMTSLSPRPDRLTKMISSFRIDGAR